MTLPQTSPLPNQPFGCELTRAPVVAPLFRRLFERGRLVRYAFRDDVDPHAIDGARIVTKYEAQCVVESVRRFSNAVAAEHVCTIAAEAGGLSTAETVVFVASPRGLWMRDSTMPSGAEIEKILATPAVFLPEPKNKSWQFSEEGMFAGQPNSCTSTVTLTRSGVCNETRCDVVQGYGDSENHVCLDRDRGFVSWRHVNLRGPRTADWQALDVQDVRPSVKAIDHESTVPACND